MRKYLLLFVVLCLHIAARGQTISSLDELDLSGLPQSTHAKALRYWFDDDDETVATVSQLSGNASIDVTGLMAGLHILHYQLMDENNMLAYVGSRVFLKINEKLTNEQISGLRYWFDDDNGHVKTLTSAGIYSLDVSTLLDGLHTIHYQVEDTNHQVYNVASGLFLKTDINAGIETVKAAKLLYWFDDETVIQQADFGEGVQILNVADLMEGLHTIHYQVLCNNGQMTPAMSSLFLRMNADLGPTVAKNLRYWFDDDPSTMTVTDVANGTQTLAVATLATGLHTLNYQLIDSNGRVGVPVTRLFLKNFDKILADGHNRVTKYQYWMNRNSETIQTVELEAAANPYTLIALLPMQKEPIQSSLFQFEITDDVPTIYAKNVLHVRFHDAQGYFSDGDKAFVDYSVKQTLTDIELLESGVRAVTTKPTGNDIKWYKLDAEPGDSLQFRLDRAATVQLFAPSGKEVLNTSGSEVVNWFGKHVTETGTYYLALHNTTAAYGNTVSVDYNHIDKYAVLRQDVSLVGNGGCSTITIDGNGFRDLYAVDLYNEHGDTIHHVYIGHESNATTSVVFDFTYAVMGKYHAKFYFAEEDKVFTDLLTVEEAGDIELTTTVTYPSMFLLGNGVVSYNAKISNSGNMTSYRTPVYIYVSSHQSDGINRIKITGLDLPKLFDGIECDSLTNEDREWMSEIVKKVEDTHYFIKSAKWDERTNDSIYVWAAYFFADVAPLQTKVLTVDVSTVNPVDVWITVPKGNNPLSANSYLGNARSRMVMRKITREELCCMRSRIECFASIAADVTSIASKIAGILGPGSTWDVALGAANCLMDGINQTISATGDILCGDTGDVQDELADKIKAAMNGISMTGSLTGCLSKLLKGKWQTFMETISKIAEGEGWISGLGLYIDYQGCEEAFATPIPNCPPNPDSGGGPSSPVNSFDPNEIYGYTAESGSKMVSAERTDVYYIIQFENDTTFATASAHDIYLTDTLDATKYDLSTFKPTRVKIGDKSAALSGEQNFVTTVDMRPEINAIAQVEETYIQQNGIMKCHISSLDPMTMEPTEYVMDGVLPVNTNGKGIGELSFDISLKEDLAHGTQVNNRAGIVFDNNDVIMTPTWTNSIDRIAPVSHVTDVQMLNDSTAKVSIAVSDELSGPWRYNVYVQYGSGAWFLGAESVPVDTTATVKVYEGISHGFYAVVTDSAGNVEQKEAAREFTYEVFGSQVDTDTKIMLEQGWNWISHNQQEPLAIEALKPASARMVGQTEELIDDSRFGWMGDLEELLPTQMYKLQMDAPLSVQLSGRLFNAGFRSVPLYAGWNWLGYPVANTMAPTEALSKLDAEEGDMLIGQDGLATYSEGQWTGTLLEMVPGQGYMFRSASNKNLFYNATAHASSRRVDTQSSVVSSQLPEGWTVDKRKYPNVMGVIAVLMQNSSVVEQGEWTIGAFCGTECRGISAEVNGTLMMNVYGQGGESIRFYAMNRETGEVLPVVESEPFGTNVLGAMRQPYLLHIGEATGVRNSSPILPEGDVYDLQGRKVADGRSMPDDRLSKGIYVATDKNRSKTQKVIRR